MNNAWRGCCNKMLVRKWTHEILVSSMYLELDENVHNMDPIYKGHHDSLVEAFLLGGNFVVNVEVGNSKGVEWYILKCTSVYEKLTNVCRYGWRNLHKPRSCVVLGLYYERIDDS